MTFGSLFSGIGGLDLGLERAGLVCRWQVECDPFCRRVLRQHWPGIPKFRDVHAFPGCSPEGKTVDLIAGGFPCQDVSRLGKQAGLAGAQAGLWTEFARIIRALSPRFVLVENVPFLLRLGADRVLSDLAAGGFDAEWDTFPSAAFGAPHIRQRLWIVAHARGERLEKSGPAGPAAAFPERGDRDNSGLDPMRVLRELPVHDPRTTRPRLCLRRDRGMVCKPLSPGSAWLSESPVCRVATRFPGRVDRIKALGNAVDPTVAEWIGRRLIAAAGG